MQRYASIINLRPDKEREYRVLHAAVWSGVLAQIAKRNIRNYSIFLRDGVLFSYLEYHGDNFAEMAKDPETQRWWALTDMCQQPVETAAEHEWWSPLAEVFHVD
jgi:L-rhamnose mutarotase